MKKKKMIVSMLLHPWYTIYPWDIFYLSENEIVLECKAYSFSPRTKYHFIRQTN
jgi:hypothetical protein